MTRTPHDQFAKQYLQELLSLLGEVETSRDVASETRQIDVKFVPAKPPPTNPQILGVLGKMAATASLYEPFRNQPTRSEVLDCQAKLNSVINEQQRKARREKTSYTEAEWPLLWILSPSCSPRLTNGFASKEDTTGKWPKGIYFLPEYQGTALVAINQLPVNQDTLWLRVLGKGKTQAQAILELEALPIGHPLRQNLGELLASWHVTIEVKDDVTQEDRELLMKLSPVYLRWRENTLEQGRQEGQQENRRQMIQSFFKVRFGSVDEELSAIVEPMLELPQDELTSLLLTASKEQLLERFGK
jgi:hypothetical protein